MYSNQTVSKNAGKTARKPKTRLDQIIHVARHIRWKNVGIALIILFGFGYGIISMATDLVTAYPEWADKRHETYLEEQLSKYDTIQVTVWEGDTAWKIQRSLAPNATSIPDLLYLAKEVNLREMDKEVNWGKILPGETYIFLVEKQ